MNIELHVSLIKDETRIVNNMLSLISAPSQGLSGDCQLKIADIRWIRIPNFLINRIINEDQTVYINEHGAWWGMPKWFNGFKDESLNILTATQLSNCEH